MMTTVEVPNRLLNVHEAAKLLGVSVSSLRLWTRARRLSTVRLGRMVRISPAEIERMVAEGTIPARKAK